MVGSNAPESDFFAADSAVVGGVGFVDLFVLEPGEGVGGVAEGLDLVLVVDQQLLVEGGQPAVAEIDSEGRALVFLLHGLQNLNLNSVADHEVDQEPDGQRVDQRRHPVPFLVSRQVLQNQQTASTSSPRLAACRRSAPPAGVGSL